MRTKKNEAGNNGRNARWFVTIEPIASQDVNRYTDVSFYLKGCLQTSSIHILPLRRTIGRRRDRIYLPSSPPSCISHGSKITPWRVNPPGLRLHCIASPVFHLSMEMAWKDQIFCGPPTYLCRKQMDDGRCWILLDQKNSLSVWQWFGACFLSSVRRINTTLPLHGQASNSFTVLLQGNVDSSAFRDNILPLYKTSHWSIILPTCWSVLVNR